MELATVEIEYQEAINETQNIQNYDPNQPPDRYRGLINLGQSLFLENQFTLACYMNSYIQCLFFTKTFKQSIIDYIIEIEYLANSDSEVFFELQELFIKMHKAEQHSIKPDKLRKVCPEPFRSSQKEQDASEFGKFFLDLLESQIKSIKELNNLVQKCFFGKIKSKITCPKCTNISEKDEIISDITVSFCIFYYCINYCQELESNSYINKIPSYQHDLLKMINQSFIIEQFSDSSFKCSNCDTLSTSFQKLTQITKLPPYLIININRFLFNAQQQIREKVMKEVKIYEQFHIKEVFPTAQIVEKDESGIFYLYAIIIHSGSRIDHGHYYTFVRESNKDDWYQLNDTKVQNFGQLDLNKLQKYDTPYILFYANLQGNSIDLFYEPEQIDDKNKD